MGRQNLEISVSVLQCSIVSRAIWSGSLGPVLILYVTPRSPSIWYVSQLALELIRNIETSSQLSFAKGHPEDLNKQLHGRDRHEEAFDERFTQRSLTNSKLRLRTARSSPLEEVGRVNSKPSRPRWLDVLPHGDRILRKGEGFLSKDDAGGTNQLL